MSQILTREEFISEVHSFGNAMESQGANYCLRTRSSPDEEATEVIAAYDAALARIAELEPLNKRIILKLHDIVNRNPLPEGSLGQNLEDVIDRQITALMRENELLGQRCKQLSDIRDEWRENAEATFDETIGLRKRIAELERSRHE